MHSNIITAPAMADPLKMPINNWKLFVKIFSTSPPIPTPKMVPVARKVLLVDTIEALNVGTCSKTKLDMAAIAKAAKDAFIAQTATDNQTIGTKVIKKAKTADTIIPATVKVFLP